ncbi:hypothetical protein T552_03380 [Pneumocystis carinii B80]|uniref:Bromo domain-containing protein n=1 Tax=Pneumocystis carinii (strain B80) TaxID=1408658 RepID=A0A0W4ZBN4_PNEC8|nr:hypothetical protein T552_03380 [Pneumocystis carinii B80]KTW25767.1 hypothetical protein T552_03380 [Pneumocystis carinii B80]
MDKTWTDISSLLLAQLVFKHGTDFSIIQTHLLQHPLADQAIYSIEDIKAQYEQLLEENQLKKEENRSIEEGICPEERSIESKLCKILYEKRIIELKKEIRKEEEAYKKITEEIEEIQSGRLPISLNIEETVTKNENNVENPADISSASVVVERKGRHEEVASSMNAEEVIPQVEENSISVEAIGNQGSKLQEKNDKNIKKQNVKKSTRSLVKKEMQVFQPENISENSSKPSALESTSLKRFQSMILPLWMSLSQHKHGTVFMGPVSDKDAPGYSSLIHFPTDMKLIRNKIRDGKITTSKQFHREVLLLFANAIMYNGEESTIAQWAKEGFAVGCRSWKRRRRNI